MIKPSPTRYTNITCVANKFKMPNTRLREICDLLKIEIITYYSRFYIANTDIEKVENFIHEFFSLIRCAKDMGVSIENIKEACKDLDIEIREVPFKKRAISQNDYIKLKTSFQRENVENTGHNKLDIYERLEEAKKLKRQYNVLDISSRIENLKKGTKMQLTLKNGIEQLVVDNPDNAEEELTALRPTADDVRYLRFLLEKLKGSDDRTIKDEWKEEFGIDEEKYKGDVPRDMKVPGQNPNQQNPNQDIEALNQKKLEENLKKSE